MIQLRDDQSKAVAKLRTSLRDHQSVLLCAAPGWGKTVKAAYMALACQNAGKRFIFAVHRKELMRQTAQTFKRFGIRFGHIGGGMRVDPFAHVQIASHATIINRPELWDADFLVPDEAHLWGGGTRAELINEFRQRGSRIIPLTGTPERGNGQGLGNIADAMVMAPPPSWLIQQGFLARYKAYAPVSPDMSGMHTRAGEYIPAEVEERFGKPIVIGDRVATYKKFANGLRTIAYAYSRKNGEDVAAAFRRAGISSVFVDGDTPDDVRVAAIHAFAKREIKVLVNCALFTEGFDLSAQVGYNVPIEAVILGKPTQSMPMAIQMMMRPMRPQERPAVLIDLVNIFAQHGFPDDERQWTLAGVPQAEREAAMAMAKCPVCFAALKGAPTKCSECQHPLDQKADGRLKIIGRQVDEVAGDVDEIDIEAMRLAKQRTVNAARTLDDLVAVAKERGHKPGWIFNVMKARGDKPNMDAIYRAMR